MSIINKKEQVFNKLSATKTLSGGIPKLKKTSSLPSVNNKGDVITFLTDLIKVLVGFQALVSTVVETLTNALPKVESGIKKVLKTELKSIVSCGVDPSLPDWIKSTGTGIVIEVKKIDFLDMLKTDPNSVPGKLIYNDVTTPLTNSTDFNTFLYEVIQNPTVTYAWPQQNSVLNITFNELGVGGNPNNTLTIKADPAYDTKTLTDLNNDFVDTLQLINSANVLNKIMDIIYGTVSSATNKAINVLEKEQEINATIDKMANNINKGTIPDSEFTFSNEEKFKQQAEAAARKRGTTNIKTFSSIPSTLPINSLTTYNQQLSNATSQIQKKDVIASNLKNLSNLSVSNVSSLDDKISGKLNFIQEIIQSMIKSIVGIVLSPKVVLVFLINYKIVYGQNNSSFLDPLDFIKKNKNLITGIVKSIASELIKILLSIALKEISLLVSKAIAKKQTEKNANRIAQLQTLVGVPLNIIRDLLNNLL